MPKKIDILMKIKDADDKLLDFYNSEPKLHPEKLTCRELNELLAAFETVYELSVKSAEKPKKNAHFRVNGRNRKYGH